MDDAFQRTLFDESGLEPDLGHDSNPTAPDEEEKQLFKKCLQFLIDWTIKRHGSPSEFLNGLQQKHGWKSRYIVFKVLEFARTDPKLTNLQKNYLTDTLSHEAIQEALLEGANPRKEEVSTLDQLFHRSREYRTSDKFAEAVRFCTKFRDYSPFNNMLVYLQNPMATFFATESHWRKAFGRHVKEDTRGMVILAPMRPVLLVYDLDDTEGPDLPKKFREFCQTEGDFKEEVLERTLENCERDLILVQRKPSGRLLGGFATTRLANQKYKVRVVVRDDLESRDAYAVLCHELAHIYLGHLGSDTDNWWPYRINLSHRTVEIEAEATSYIVCKRAGIDTRSEAYLSTHIRDQHDLEMVSIDYITRVASRIEEMGKRLLPPRKSKVKKKKAKR